MIPALFFKKGVLCFMYMFRRFSGFVCILGCLFCTLATTQLTTFATEIVQVTDTWIPLDDAWDTVAPLYDNYNTALSENSGVTITADNYKEYVIKSIIGNFVATHEAYVEDVSLDGLIDVIMADADLVNALGSATLVNPLNGAYYLGEAMGASLRSSIDNFLKTTFGLTDIMTTSEAVGKDFPYGRVFVKEVATSDIRRGIYWYQLPNTRFSPDYFLKDGGPIWACNVNGQTMLLALVYSRWSTTSSDWGYTISMSYSYNGTRYGWMVYPSNFNGEYQAISNDDAIADFFGGETYTGTDYTDPIVVINDEDPPIISPTSVYNDWSTISNYYYDTYNTDYVTYNTGDSIYNYTYYYSINNYTNDMPLWVVNGKNLTVYDFDRETFYDFSNQNYTVSDDLVWDSGFFDFVWDYLPVELTVLLITMLVASAFFLLFKH